MQERQFQKNLDASFNAARRLGLTDWDHLANHRSLRRNKEFNRVALNASASYQEIYREGLSLRYYNFLLNDFSFFQFTRTENNGNLVLRYAYFPNPYELPFEDEELIADLEEEAHPFDLSELIDQSLDDATVKIDTPPLRYDYDCSQYVPTRHPVSHLHVGRLGGSRWPVRKILTPLSFLLFVIKQYYTEAWENELVEIPGRDDCRGVLDNLLSTEASRCDHVDEKYFLAVDEQHFYIV